MFSSPSTLPINAIGVFIATQGTTVILIIPCGAVIGARDRPHQATGNRHTYHPWRAT